MLTLRLSLYTLASAFAKSFKKLFSTWHLGLELRECRRHEYVVGTDYFSFLGTFAKQL